MTPIREVIKAFEFCLPYYEEALKEDWDYLTLSKKKMDCGLCYFYKCKKQQSLLYEEVFSIGGYYYNILDMHGKIADYPDCDNTRPFIKFRHDFLKSQIEKLQSLEKKGYTHI